MAFGLIKSKLCFLPAKTQLTNVRAISADAQVRILSLQDTKT